MIQVNETKQSSINAIMATAREQIKDILGMPVSITYKIKVNDISTEHVIQTVCKVCKITWSSMSDNSKKTEIVVPRQICMWFLRHYAGLSTPKIVKEFGKDDATTARSAIERVQNMIETNDPLYAPAIAEIERCLLKLAE